MNPLELSKKRIMSVSSLHQCPSPQAERTLASELIGRLALSGFSSSMPLMPVLSMLHPKTPPASTFAFTGDFCIVIGIDLFLGDIAIALIVDHAITLVPDHIIDRLQLNHL